jgi:hypothetical protein
MYTRGTGAPVTVTDTFALLNPATQYTLKVFNGGLQHAKYQLVSLAYISLNGVRIVGPENFNANVYELDLLISPKAVNSLSVQNLGILGSVLTIEIIGVDNDPPSIAASPVRPPNAAGWYNSDVTVNFTCSDKTSGIASCPSPITVRTEGAKQVVSGTATDLAGNAASASVTVSLDKTPPTIAGTISPPPDPAGFNSTPVTVSFTCSDALSGVASCPSPVTLTMEGAGQIVTRTAADVAGNLATLSITVNISFDYFLIRSYLDTAAGGGQGKCLDYAGPYSGAPVFLNDCSQAHPVRVVELADRMDAQGNTFSHEVLLFAGKQVIAIHVSQQITTGGPPGPPTTEFALELQDPWYSAGRFVVPPPQAENQIFRLDGDSIILEGNPAQPTPCLNTANTPPLCPDPPPQLVVQIQKARGVNGSPIEVNLRNLSEHEFWDFVATNGSGSFPTKGFKSVASADELWNNICNDPVAVVTTSGIVPPTQKCGTFKAGWGTVIVVTTPNPCNRVPGPAPGLTQNIGGCIDLSNYPPILLPAGTTLRGDRRGTLLGPQLYMSLAASRPTAYGVCGQCTLAVQGDYVRITGLRVRGQSRSRSKALGYIDGILVQPVAADLTSPSGLASTTELIALIDHNDVSDWTGTAIGVSSPYRFDSSHNVCLTQVNQVPTPNFSQTCSTSVPDPTNPSAGSNIPITSDPATIANARVERNFVHHNARDDGGYGIGGGRLVISGNTFVFNRHSIASDGEPHAEYRAWYNLVLSTSATGDQDFDMHGTNGGYGGVAGYYVDIYSNAFLGTGHSNYWLRGFPSKNTDFHRNISLQGQGSAVEFKRCSPFSICLGGPPAPINIFDQTFGSSSDDPTTRLGPASFGVGDFDGDGNDDLFLATGAAWYFSPGGARDWRFLSAKTDKIDGLLLGDFDGDGRTDVVGINPSGQLVVSWGGISDWEVLNSNPLQCSSTADMAVGKFLDHPVGDRRDDIFCANGLTWYLSYGGSGPFNFAFPLANSFRVKDLRFGDFNGDGKTDVFGVVNGAWQVSYAQSSGFALSNWTPLPVSLTNAVDGLFVADFVSAGHAAVARVCDPLAFLTLDSWCLWDGSTPNWQPYHLGLNFPSVAGIGHFLGRVDVNGNPLPSSLLLWNGTEIWLSGGGTSFASSYSTQDMR